LGLWATTIGGLDQAVQAQPQVLDLDMNSEAGKVVAELFFISLSGFILAVSFQATLTKDWFEGFSIRDNYKFNLKKMKFEKEAVEYKLVQGQLSPHLLKNILTVIHEMVLLKKPEAADSVVRLKEILDYLLYKSSPDRKVPLIKEVEFARGILQLRALGLDNPLKIATSYPEDDVLEKFEIPPLVLTPFIENLFTHCNFNESDGMAIINLEVDSMGNLSFSVRNSIGLSAPRSENGGLGLSTLRKRLDDFYLGKYSLETRSEGSFFQSDLKIKLVS
jgi:sensor histidine kinase YesM